MEYKAASKSWERYKRSRCIKYHRQADYLSTRKQENYITCTGNQILHIASVKFKK